MSKILALQIDPLDSLKSESDSSLMLAYEAQVRGYNVFTYQVENLSFQDGIISAQGCFTQFSEQGFSFQLGKLERLSLEEADLILIRQDPPFNARYLSNTYILELLENKGKRILNSPKGIRNAGEKTLPLLFTDLIPTTLVTENFDAIYAFSKEYESIVIKPLYGFGGSDVMSLANPSQEKLKSVYVEYIEKYQAPLVVQPMLKEVFTSEKRIHLIDGKPVNVFRRVPKDGDIRANLAQGGRAEVCDFTSRDLEICEAVGPTLRALGLYLVGLDVIGDYLIEINVTSPTGLRAAQKLYGKNLAAMFFDALE